MKWNSFLGCIQAYTLGGILTFLVFQLLYTAMTMGFLFLCFLSFPFISIRLCARYILTSLSWRHSMPLLSGLTVLTGPLPKVTTSCLRRLSNYPRYSAAPRWTPSLRQASLWQVWSMLLLAVKWMIRTVVPLFSKVDARMMERVSWGWCRSRTFFFIRYCRRKAFPNWPLVILPWSSTCFACWNWFCVAHSNFWTRARIVPSLFSLMTISTGSQGVIVMRCNTCLLVGVHEPQYSNGRSFGQVNTDIGRLADYFIENGY